MSVPRETRGGATNSALLIDFDNVTLGIRSDLQTQLRQLLNSEMIKGKVAVQRAYADWRRYPQYIVPLSESSIDLIFAPAFGSNKKNATDIRLAIDALELVFTRPEIGTFILLSGDSDFSSLVLKLKEYGKWVIGVGIRESASDLLVQNCDEYYSYNELTGLAKEGEIEVLRRDPWELVVEAVLRMLKGGDVMRSDRLKQVMQQIDPHFDEKDAGFNRFSKFVLEAGHRGLLELHKLEGGQYEIDLGSDANVPPDVSPPTLSRESAEAKPRKKPAKSRVEKATGSAGLTLASAFALLRKALVELGAVGGESTDAEQLRERMTELADDPDDALFRGPRFQRMLRQASDAALIEMAKDGDSYLLKLIPKAPTEEEAPATEQKPSTRRKRKTTTTTKRRTKAAGEEEQPASEPTAEITAVPEPPKRSTRTKATKRAKATRSRTKKTESDAPPAEMAVPDASAAEPDEAKPKAAPARGALRGRGGTRKRPPPAPNSHPGAEPTVTADGLRLEAEVIADPTTDAETTRRSLRGRGSSRTRKTKASGTGTPDSEIVASAPAAPAPPVVAAPETRPLQRSVRGRGGSRGRKPAAATRPSGETPAIAEPRATSDQTPRHRSPSDTPAQRRRKTPKGADAKPGEAGRSSPRKRTTPPRISTGSRRATTSRSGARLRVDPDDEPPPSSGRTRARRASPRAKPRPPDPKQEEAPEAKAGRVGGLFSKITAALQRAVHREENDEE